MDVRFKELIGEWFLKYSKSNYWYLSDEIYRIMCVPSIYLDLFQSIGDVTRK